MFGRSKHYITMPGPKSTSPNTDGLSSNPPHQPYNQPSHIWVLNPPRQCFNPFLDPEFCIEDFDFGNCDTTEIETSIGGDELVELTPDNSQNTIEAPSAGGAGWTFSSYWVLIGLGFVLALVVPAGTISYARWSLGRLGYPTAAYATMSLLGRFAGVRRQPQETPWEYSSRLSREFPDHTEAVKTITVGFVTTRYGPSKNWPQRR